MTRLQAPPTITQCKCILRSWKVAWVIEPWETPNRTDALQQISHKAFKFQRHGTADGSAPARQVGNRQVSPDREHGALLVCHPLHAVWKAPVAPGAIVARELVFVDCGVASSQRHHIKGADNSSDVEERLRASHHDEIGLS